MCLRHYTFFILHSALAVCALTAQTPPDRGLSAHRGANATHPENTLPAFREAVRLGAQQVEFDVRRTKDGHLVIMHDSTVNRTTDGEGRVSEMTFEQIRKLDAGIKKDPKFAGTKIPTLEEALDVLPRDIWINIHLKADEETALKTAATIIEKKRTHQAFIACPQATAATLRKTHSQIMLCNMERRDGDTSRYVRETIEQKYHFLQLTELCTPDEMRQLKAAGVKVNYFGVKSPEHCRELFEAGVDFPLVDDLEQHLHALALTAPITPLPGSITDTGKRTALTPRHAIICADANLATLASDTIHRWTNLRLPIRPDKSDITAPTITITLDPAPAVPETSHPEGYALAISESGDIDIFASTRAGAFYALQTLTQLLAAPRFDTSALASPLARQRPIATERSDILPKRESKIENSIPLPALTIHDSPRFAWRGVHLDEGRHFFGTDAVKRLLDTMALFKFNTLHWHLTEDQGWRIEIKKYPKLTQIGAWRTDSPMRGARAKSGPPDGIPHGGYYTQDQIREIVAYARQRHITIIPEVEIPGHSAAALAAYPQYGNTDIPGYTPKVATTWGVHPYTYAPKEETFAFLCDILDEVCDLFPDAPYIHIGGDEAPKKQWETSPFAQSVMRGHNLKNADELQSWILRRIEKHLATRGRKVIGWEEIQEGGLSPTAVMMVWRDWKLVLNALDQGNKVILTPRTHFYFDYPDENVPDEPYYSNNSSWRSASRIVPMEKVYRFEPLSEGVSPVQEAQILGCQASLWGEYMYDWPKVEYFLFPRALAASEVAWRPRGARDWREFQTRLPSALRLLDKLGVNYQSPPAPKTPVTQ